MPYQRPGCRQGGMGHSRVRGHEHAPDTGHYAAAHTVTLSPHAAGSVTANCFIAELHRGPVRVLWAQGQTQQEALRALRGHVARWGRGRETDRPAALRAIQEAMEALREGDQP